jgi:hypothetical protein
LREIAVYIEGGGDKISLRAELRQGFDALLRPQKEKAREGRSSLKLVCCGRRQEAYEAFMNELKVSPSVICALLVDSETSLPSVPQGKAKDSAARRDHLMKKEGRDGRGQGDGWNLKDAEPDTVHLMVQCMEAWIVADPEALEAFYGKEFKKNKLPKRLNLEEEPKADVLAKLEAATENCSKGKYAKIKHASQLLRKVDPEQVAKRGPRFSIFRDWLSVTIDGEAFLDTPS